MFNIFSRFYVIITSRNENKSNEEYTELYHKYFSEFITSCFDSGYFTETIDSVKEMISPYVEKDPTKFCTYEEFENGVGTLREFCLLRAESIKGQLDGTIGASSDTQSSEALIDAGNLQISDMGSMSNTTGTGKNDGNGNINEPQSEAQSSGTKDSRPEDSGSVDADFSSGKAPPLSPDENKQNNQAPDKSDSAEKQDKAQQQEKTSYPLPHGLKSEYTYQFSLPVLFLPYYSEEKNN